MVGTETSFLLHIRTTKVALASLAGGVQICIRAERMNPKRFFICVSFLLCGCAVQQSVHSFPAVSELRPQPDLPNPLVALDGHAITTSVQWFNERRPELKALFGHYMYGPIPPKPASMQIDKRGDYQDFLGSQATLKLRTLQIGPGNGPRIDLMLVIPNRRAGPAPVFLAMNFCGVIMPLLRTSGSLWH